MSEGRFPWLHVCYVDSERKTYKLWEYACKPCDFIHEVSFQSAASWLVEIIKRIERCEISNCRQSAIDPDDCFNLLAGQRPTFSKMVGYSIPNITEAAIELVELIESTESDYVRFLDTSSRTLTWGRKYETLTPKMMDLLKILLSKYPNLQALKNWGTTQSHILLF